MAHTNKQRHCNHNNNENGNDNDGNAGKGETNTRNTEEEEVVIDVASLMNKRKKSKQIKTKYDKLQSVVTVTTIIAAAIVVYFLSSASPSEITDKKTTTEQEIISQELNTLQSFLLGGKQTHINDNSQRVWELSLHVQPLLHMWSLAEYDRVTKGNTRARSKYGRTPRHENTMKTGCTELKSWADSIYNNVQVTSAAETTTTTTTHSTHTTSTCDVALATFIYERVLTEYAVLHDNLKDHTVALLRVLHMLHDWDQFMNDEESMNSIVANTSICNQCIVNVLYNENNNSDQTYIDKGVEQWHQFCNTSLTSYDVMMTRNAAILEELIVLHPDYIAFRLHYLTSFVLRDSFVNTSAENTTSIQKANQHIQVAKRLIKHVNDKLSAVTSINASSEIFIAVTDLLQLHLSMLQSLLNYTTSLQPEHNYSVPFLSKAIVKKKVEHVLKTLDNTTIYKSITEDNVYWHTEGNDDDVDDDKVISPAMAEAWDRNKVQLSLITPQQLELLRRTLQQVVDHKLFTSSLRSKISQLITKLH